MKPLFVNSNTESHSPDRKIEVSLSFGIELAEIKATAKNSATGVVYEVAEIKKTDEYRDADIVSLK